jgi:hypothetical protein
MSTTPPDEIVIDVTKRTTRALEAYDDMMVECALKLDNSIAPLAMSIWSEVLKELDRRGRLKLVSGSFDDVGNALIQRVR